MVITETLSTAENLLPRKTRIYGKLLVNTAYCQTETGRKRLEKR
jgi:hypothetical protein